MERYTISKLAFLAWWGIPSVGMGIIFGAIAGIINALTGGSLAQILGIAAIVLTTIFATVQACFLLFWTKVE